MCSVIACLAAFEDCKEPEGYDLGWTIFPVIETIVLTVSIQRPSGSSLVCQGGQWAF